MGVKLMMMTLLVLSDVTLRVLRDVTLLVLGEVILLVLSDVTLLVLSEVTLLVLSEVTLLVLSDVTLLVLGEITLLVLGEVTLLVLSEIRESLHELFDSTQSLSGLVGSQAVTQQLSNVVQLGYTRWNVVEEAGGRVSGRDSADPRTGGVLGQQCVTQYVVVVISSRSLTQRSGLHERTRSNT
jgi:hypothetical protein